MSSREHLEIAVMSLFFVILHTSIKLVRAFFVKQMLAVPHAIIYEASPGK